MYDAIENAITLKDLFKNVNNFRDFLAKVNDFSHEHLSWLMVHIALN